MRIPLPAFLIAVASACLPAQQDAPVTPLDTVQLRQRLDSARAAMGIPGVSVAIVTPVGTWTATSGVANGANEPVEQGMVFELGSITKPFIAATVLDLCAAGTLSLDDTLTRWLPDFPNARGVTVRHLLQHTSGLHNYTENPAYVPALRADFSRRWAPEDSYRFMKEPYFAPGAGWHYSNANYQLLGRIVERVEGRPLAEVLRRRLFEKHGLTRSFFAATDSVAAPRAHAFLDITGDGKPEDFTAMVPNTSFITAAGAAGSIVATAADAARFAHALWSGAIVRDRWFTEMTRWVERGDGMQYGLGVIRYTPDGRELLGHKGNTVGYSASVWHEPARRVTVAVLTNVHARDVTPLVLLLLR